MIGLFLGFLFVIVGLVLWYFNPPQIHKLHGLVTLKKAVAIIIIAISVLILFKGLLNNMFFIADSDKSYVVQWPTGKLITHFEPGFKLKMFGKIYSYDRVIAVATPVFVAEKGTGGKYQTEDIGALEEESNTVSGTLPPPLVRFTDAAKGNAYGIIRVALPLNSDGLLNIHRELGSIDALVDNVLKNVFRSAAIASARLMSIQDYITKRGSDFDEFFSDQVSGGLYKTYVQERVIIKIKPTEADKTKVEGKEISKDDIRVDEEGRSIEEYVEIVHDDEGNPVRQGINDIARYGLQVITAKITYINPEDRVRRLIGDQRDAEARAALAENKRRASLLEAEAEEAEGQKQVAKVRAEELADKERLVIQEEAKKAVTIIQAQKNLEQAKLDKQTAIVRAEEAKYKKEEMILLGKGEAEKKAAIMKADGALKQKLETYERVMGKFAEEFAQQKWVPEVQMVGSGENGNEAANLINLLTAKTLRDLGLNMAIPKGNSSQVR